MTQIIVQSAVCANMEGVVEGSEIVRYICTVTGEAPACHKKASEAGFVDLNDCKDRI